MPAPLQTDHVREANRRAVYRALGGAGAVSRTDLARRTGLSVPTVAAILGDLAAAGAVRAAGQDPGTGGRPAQRFALAADARHVVAVDLSGHRARAHRVDLLGRPGAARLGPTLAPGADAALTDWLRALVADPSAPPVARVGLAVPGVVDPRDGRVGLAPALGWDDEPVGARLEAALGVPVRLENDVNALALAELHYGAGRGLAHVVYVAIGSGIGAGIVVHGRLVRGAHAAAGEIGYAASPFATAAGEIGYATGPFATAAGEIGYAASPFATAAAAIGDAAGPGDVPAARPSGPGGPLERDLLALAARFAPPDAVLDLGTPARRDAFDRFVAGLRPVLQVLACALDPERVVVAWPADPDGRLATALGPLGPGRATVPVVAGALGPDAAARGVARLALEDVEADLCRRAPRLAPDPHLPGRPARERTAHA